MPCRAQQTIKEQVNISFFHINYYGSSNLPILPTSVQSFPDALPVIPAKAGIQNHSIFFSHE
jgi:hypothetical protein